MNSSSHEPTVKVYCHPGIPYKSFIKRSPTEKKSPLQDDSVRFYIRASTALWKGLHLLPLKAEDRILFPSYHCGIELDVLRQAGFHCDFYKVDAKLNIDWTDIERSVTEQTKVFYLIHYFGFPQDMMKIMKFCSQHNLLLIEDCALSLHARYKDKQVGTFGNIAIYSMRKTLALPAGGALRINDTRLSLPAKDRSRILYELMKAFYLVLMRDLSRFKLGSIISKIFIRENDMAAQGEDNTVFHDKWKMGGMSIISLLLLRMTSPEAIYERRRDNFKVLLEALHTCKHVKPLIDRLQGGACPYAFPVTVSGDTSDFIKFCRQRGVMADRHWSDIHRDLPVELYYESRWLKDNVIVLPVHQNLGKADIALIKHTVLEWDKEQDNVDSSISAT